ncbi:uncharacterized protein LOC135331595 [Halichondria panicea]|uniref:uncharacterized protein LOC135331595 n=1 Tax=Halichondria panicea TaxID=6063 RepID=UPI00312B73E8
MAESNQLLTEISIPLLGAVVSILTVAFAICLCAASGCCPISTRRCRENRRRNLLLRPCRTARYSNASKCCANETCPICLDDFRESEKMVVSPCRHGFHKDCIAHCLERSPNCPVCKNIIGSERQANERTELL